MTALGCAQLLGRRGLQIGGPNESMPRAQAEGSAELLRPNAGWGRRGADEPGQWPEGCFNLGPQRMPSALALPHGVG